LSFFKNFGDFFSQNMIFFRSNKHASDIQAQSSRDVNLERKLLANTRDIVTLASESKPGETQATLDLEKISVPVGVGSDLWQSVVKQMQDSKPMQLRLANKGLTTPQLHAILNALPPVVQKDIRRLDVSHNNLDKLPGVIGNFVALQNLIVSHNHFKTLPAALECLAELRVLDAGHNRIEHVPVEVCYLSNLENLNLDYNQLHNLPAEMGLLQNLKTLTIVGNFIIQLPDTIGTLKELSEVDAVQNPMTGIPGKLKKITRRDIRP
jgi:Leucine-rich repeat (LRR) protein